MKKRLAKKMTKRQSECAAKTKKVTVALEAEEIKTAESEAAVPEVTEAKVIEAEAKEPEAAATEAGMSEAKAKTAKKINIFYQFSNHQAEQQEIITRIKNQWKEQGNMVKDLKDLVIYLKTEENKAYYVINDRVKGSVAVCE